jgi:hypothetical protein
MLNPGMNRSINFFLWYYQSHYLNLLLLLPIDLLNRLLFHTAQPLVRNPG